MGEFKDKVGYERPEKISTTPKKYNAIELGEFCKDKECRWCKDVNFGNGVKIPHCVLRGWEVRPHGKCIHLKEFLQSANLTEKDVDMSVETIREEE